MLADTMLAKHTKDFIFSSLPLKPLPRTAPPEKEQPKPKAWESEGSLLILA